MKLFAAKDYEAMSLKAANIVASQITLNPKTVLGLATGSSPVGLYKELIKSCQSGQLDFSKVTSFNLDEYLGLPPENEQSYIRFMKDNLFDHININPDKINIPNGLAKDPHGECAEYDKRIVKCGGIDLQVLGIGHNGHVGFNEPASYFMLDTHVVDLTPSTIQANKRFFESEDEVPKKALTMGIRAIVQAKKIVLVCSGEDKAQILYDALYGKVTPEIPASILQIHPDCYVVADEGALSLIRKNNKI